MGVKFTPKEPKPSPAAQIAELEQELAGKAGKDEVQAVWDQMAAAYQEGVQEA